jgi:phage terminase Nu1 subunit (DNA packaging protein)
MKKLVLTAKEIAKVLNVKPVTIRALVADGMSRKARNKYDLAECANFYAVKLQNALENKGAPMAGGDVTLWQKEKARTLTVVAELKELELAKKRGELVTVEESKRVLLDLAYMVKARIMAIPARAAPDLVGQDSRTMVQAILERHVHESLSLLAKDKPDPNRENL